MIETIIDITGWIKNQGSDTVSVECRSLHFNCDHIFHGPIGEDLYTYSPSFPGWLKRHIKVMATTQMDSKKVDEWT